MESQLERIVKTKLDEASELHLLLSSLWAMMWMEDLPFKFLEELLENNLLMFNFLMNEASPEKQM